MVTKVRSVLGCSQALYVPVLLGKTSRVLSAGAASFPALVQALGLPFCKSEQDIYFPFVIFPSYKNAPMDGTIIKNNAI